MTEKTRESAPPLIKKVWEFLEDQLEITEKREMSVETFVTSTNKNIFVGFWSEHATGELRTRNAHEILRFLSP